MDLNHIELPAFIVADLYHSVLVEEETTIKKSVPAEKLKEEIAAPGSATAPLFKSLGGNQKNILIIVNDETALHMPENELVFLTGILSACKLTLADVAILNLNNYPGNSYKDLIAFFKSRIVLLFAIEPAAFGLPMNFPSYQIQPFAGSSFLYSPSLKELENNKEEKRKLWDSLRRLFNIQTGGKTGSR